MMIIIIIIIIIKVNLPSFNGNALLTTVFTGGPQLLVFREKWIQFRISYLLFTAKVPFYYYPTFISRWSDLIITLMSQNQNAVCIYIYIYICHFSHASFLPRLPPLFRCLIILVKFGETLQTRSSSICIPSQSSVTAARLASNVLLSLLFFHICICVFLIIGQPMPYIKYQIELSFLVF